MQSDVIICAVFVTMCCESNIDRVKKAGTSACRKKGPGKSWKTPRKVVENHLM